VNVLLLPWVLSAGLSAGFAFGPLLYAKLLIHPLDGLHPMIGRQVSVSHHHGERSVTKQLGYCADIGSRHHKP
jgi:hypothetical protein